MSQQWGHPDLNERVREWVRVGLQKNCWYCGSWLRPRSEGVGERHPFRATKDHMVPVSRGGEKHPRNIVLACRRCNERKAAMTVDEFREVVGGAAHKFHGEKALPEWATEFDGE